jgi:hypothetical protein
MTGDLTLSGNNINEVSNLLTTGSITIYSQTNSFPSVCLVASNGLYNQLCVTDTTTELINPLNMNGFNITNSPTIDNKVNKSGDNMTGVLNFGTYGFEMVYPGIPQIIYSQFNGTGNSAGLFTEIDANNYLAFTNNRLEWTNAPRTSKNYVYQDVGVGAIPNTFNMAWDWNNSRGTSYYGVVFVGVSSVVNDLASMQTSNANYVGADYSGNSNTYTIVAKNGPAAQTTSAVSISIVDNTNYTINLTVSETSSVLHVYTYHTTTDIAGSPTTLTLASNTYQYAFIFNNYDDGAIGIHSGWIDNMLLSNIYTPYSIYCVKVNSAGGLYTTAGHC